MSVLKEESELIDRIEKEYETSNYIHVNLPSNNESIEMYTEEIESLERKKASDYDLSDYDEARSFTDCFNDLKNKLNYYMKVDEIYQKTNILIENEYSFDLNESGFDIIINPEAKKQLKRTIQVLNEKINEFKEYETEFIKVML